MKTIVANRHPQKRTDSDYYSKAREAFYRQDYPEFLRLAAFITSGYGESPASRKMRAIATALRQNNSEQVSGGNR